MAGNNAVRDFNLRHCRFGFQSCQPLLSPLFLSLSCSITGSFINPVKLQEKVWFITNGSPVFQQVFCESSEPKSRHCVLNSPSGFLAHFWRMFVNIKALLKPANYCFLIKRSWNLYPLSWHLVEGIIMSQTLVDQALFNGWRLLILFSK